MWGNLRVHVRKLIALSAIAATYAMARLPEISGGERQRIADQFRFERLPLPDPTGPLKSVREVHPSLRHISAWISAVGAGAALNDLDGDGLSNDVCWVDPRANAVLVAPAPGTSARYPLLQLTPQPLPYDARTMAPMGCLPGDIDEDGRVDLVVYYWGRTPVAFLRTDRGYRPREIMPRVDRWFTNAAFFSDLDGDGHADLVIGNYFPDGARILDPDNAAPQFMQHSMSTALNSGRKHILLWQQPGSFQEQTGVLADEVALGWTLAAGAADLDGDLLPEIYFANDFGPDRLLHNRSKPGRCHFVLTEAKRGFDKPKSKVLGQDSFKGMGIDFADLNGDGQLDLYVSNIAAPYALEESHFLFLSNGSPALFRRGIAPYTDESERLGLSRSSWSWEARLADFNNDGVLEATQATGFVKGTVNRWPELHEVAMSNDQALQFPAAWHTFQPGDDLSGQATHPFFVRASDGRYYDVAGAIGIDQAQVSRGIAVGDVDGDGRLDYVLANQWETSYLVHNRAPNPGSYLTLRVVYPSGVPAIGAEARVDLPDGNVAVAQVDGGSGHSGKRSPELHFGFGKASRDVPVRVVLRWRDANGLHETTKKLPLGRHQIVLKEKES